MKKFEVGEIVWLYRSAKRPVMVTIDQECHTEGMYLIRFDNQGKKHYFDFELFGMSELETKKMLAKMQDDAESILYYIENIKKEIDHVS